jgi:hypothetical protein
MPPTEHEQEALRRNLAAELIHAEAGRPPLLPSRIRYPQELGGITLTLLYRLRLIIEQWMNSAYRLRLIIARWMNSEKKF